MRPRAALAIGGFVSVPMCVAVLSGPSVTAQATTGQNAAGSLAACLPADGPGPGAPGAARAGGPPQAQPPNPDIAVPAIAGLTAGGKWTKLLTLQKGNADGIVIDKDGNILNAAEDDGTIQKIDPSGKVTVLVADAQAGSLSLDRQGRLFGITRGRRGAGQGPAEAGREDAAVQYTPQRRTVAKLADGSKLGYRTSDIVADNRGGAFVSMMGPCLFYAGADSLLHLVENTPRIAGVAVSPDERILYAAFNGSNGAPGSIVAYDITGPGVVANRRTLATLPAGNGNSLLVDAGGRIYTPNARSIQVYDKDGKHLGTLPTPDTAITVALGGPDRKTMFVVSEDSNPPAPGGGRQVSRTFWTLPMLTTGFKDRGK